MVKILDQKHRQITCPHCNIQLEWSDRDIRWTHNEPDYYFITCPVCGKTVWLEKNQWTEEAWNHYQRI